MVSSTHGAPASCRLRSASCGTLFVFLRGCFPEVISMFPGGTPETAAMMAALPEDKGIKN